MIFQILGPLRVLGRKQTGSSLQRAILAALLLRAGDSVGVAELAAILWEDPPPSAAANIRSHLTGLRRCLDASAPGLSDRLTTYRGSPSSYGIEVAPDEFDLSTFERASRRGRDLLSRGEAAAAVTTIEGALGLWCGSFGSDLPSTLWFDSHAVGLNSERINACQDLFTARLLANQTEMLPYRIERVIAEAPYRQRLWSLLVAAHCIDGDVANALAAVQRCRALFADELGLDLPPEVGALRAAALRWDRGEVLRLVGQSVSVPDSPGVETSRRGLYSWADHHTAVSGASV